jgi:hypothetical protein
MKPLPAPARLLAPPRHALTLPGRGIVGAPQNDAGQTATADLLLRADRAAGSPACVLAVGLIAAPRRDGWCAEPPQ